MTEALGSRFAAVPRAELAALIPDLLMAGQFVDRSGLAWCVEQFGFEEMAQIAIEEWGGASPIYTGVCRKRSTMEVTTSRRLQGPAARPGRSTAIPRL